MASRSFKVDLPRIAAALKQPGGSAPSSAMVPNTGALSWTARSDAPLLAIGFGVGAMLVWSLRDLSALAIGATALFGVALVLGVLLWTAPLSFELSPAGLGIRRLYHTRTIPLSDFDAVLFGLSFKQADRSDHERFFHTRLRMKSGKERFVGVVAESAVAELTRHLPHSKIVIQVITPGTVYDLRPHDVP